MAVTLDTLTEARLQYDALMKGQAVARFKDSNGEEVVYTQANIGRLGTYIEELKRELGLLPPSSTGPMRVFF